MSIQHFPLTRDGEVPDKSYTTSFGEKFDRVTDSEVRLLKAADALLLKGQKRRKEFEEEDARRARRRFPFFWRRRQRPRRGGY